MNKQKVVSAVLKELEEKKLELEDSVEKFRKSAGEQSKSIESWSDSSRAQFNMMAGAIQNDVKAIESAAVFLKTLGNNSSEVVGVGSLVVVKEGGQNKLFFMVPEGSGGFAVKADGKEILAIASTSPIGNILMDKKTGETSIFSAIDGDDKNFEIVSVE